jgi:hypothetical protein
MSDFMEMKRQFIAQCSDWDSWGYDKRVQSFGEIVPVYMYIFWDRAAAELDNENNKYYYAHCLKVFDLAQKYLNNKAFL